MAFSATKGRKDRACKRCKSKEALYVYVFNCHYSRSISHSCFSIKGGTRTSKQNGINLWLKNYDHLYANEGWPYASGRPKRIMQSHKFWVFLLLHTLPGQVERFSSSCQGDWEQDWRSWFVSQDTVMTGCFGSCFFQRFAGKPCQPDPSNAGCSVKSSTLAL